MMDSEGQRRATADVEHEPMNRSASDLSLNSTDRDARPPKAVKPARPKAWRLLPDRAAMLTQPKYRARWLEPYLAAVEARVAGNETSDEIEHLLYVVACPKWMRKAAKAEMLARLAAREDAPKLQRRGVYGSPATVLHPDRFRSDFERRLAAAFDRLGIRYRYEDARLPWVDNRGRHHVYTPDFTLADLHMTFVEVKGFRPTEPDDRVKMWHVMRQNAITLLLWDAPIIEMVEDMESASEVVGLLASTRLAA